MCETATPRYRREVKQSKESGGISFPPCLTFFTFFTLRFWVNVSRLSAPGPKLCPNIASMKTTHLPPQPSIDPLRSLRSERGTPRLRTLSLLFLFLLLFRSSFTFSHFHDFIFLFSIFLSLLSCCAGAVSADDDDSVREEKLLAHRENGTSERGRRGD